MLEQIELKFLFYMVVGYLLIPFSISIVVFFKKCIL